MRSNCYWIGPSLSPGVSQVSITLLSSYDPFSIMLYRPFSHHMSYAPILTHPRTNSFPMTTISLCFDDSFVLMTHFISLTILPIILTLLLAFVSYCCSIYGFERLWSSVTAVRGTARYSLATRGLVMGGGVGGGVGRMVHCNSYSDD